MFGHAYRGFAAPSQPRFFDKVDTLIGTPEEDTFELEPPGLGTQSLDDNFISMGIPIIVDSSEDTEVDLLVYQEAESFDYIPGFTDPPESSYTIIENFDPSEDQILIDDGRGYVTIMSNENDIPMLSDVIEPSLGDFGYDFEYVPLFQ